MTDLRTAAQQALEAMDREIDTRRCKASTLRAMIALRAALAQQAEPVEPAYKTYPIRMNFEWVGGQWLFNDNPIDNGEWCITLGNGGWVIYPKMEQAEPVQEPVAWLTPRNVDSYSRPDLGYETSSKTDYGAFPVYTAPPQRKPLTQEQLYALYDEHATHQEEGPAMSGWFDFARAIERAHGIGGQE